MNMQSTVALLIPHLAPITAKVRGFDERLHAIAFKPGPLSADEQAYLDAAEREQAAIERSTQA